jgi:hypothetical protein
MSNGQGRGRVMASNLMGKQFGYLLVIGHAKGTGKWLVRCVCGQKRLKCSYELVSGQSRSCSCKRAEFSRLRGRSDYHRLKHMVFNNYRNHAKRRGMAFDLTFEAVKTLIALPCHYCGSSPSNTWANYADTFLCKSVNFAYSGVDRVDSTKGYMKDNVVPCCAICNRAKSDLPLEQFQVWVQRLIAFSTS